jgi:putative ABC transport system substrate-binding protein
LATRVSTGLVPSLAKPRGNITGFSSLGSELSGTWVELASEAVPRLSRLAVLWNSENPSNERQVRETEQAARSVGVQLHPVAFRRDDDFDSAFSAMKKRGAGAAVVFTSAVAVRNARRIAALAAQERLPTIAGFRELVDAGGLIAYGPRYEQMWDGVASYVHKILDGARPADLPVQQPTQFELVVNLKTAQALGLTIPQSVLVRADEVIK